MTINEWLEDVQWRSKNTFKISWTKKFRAIQRANKRYPYKLWMSYQTDDSPIWYRINNEEDEQSAIKDLSDNLKYSEEIYENRS